MAGDELEQALERAREAQRRRLDRDRPVCPYCDRVMTDREKAEQGACNDCYAGHGGHAL